MQGLIFPFTATYAKLSRCLFFVLYNDLCNAKRFMHGVHLTPFF